MSEEKMEKTEMAATSNGGVENGGYSASTAPPDSPDTKSPLELEREESIREAYVKIYQEKPQMNQPEYDQFYGHSPRPKRTLGMVCREACQSCDCSARGIGKSFLSFLPFIKIMQLYEKEWISLDLIAGLTIGIMQIPQGLAYSLLAELDPVVGLYVSFFPVFIYYFFGTSRHVSLGTFAVVSLMVGTTVVKFDCSKPGNETAEVTTPSFDSSSATYDNATIDNSEYENACKLGIATAVTFLAGLIQLTMGLLKFGFVVKYLSVPLTRGFTTGCAMHVFTSQVKYVVGISTDRYSGPLKLIYTYRDIFMNITDIQWAAVVLSTICLIILYVTKEYLNPPFKKKLKIPIPIDLIVVILGTVASGQADFSGKYCLTIVGDIATGIPPPVFPPVDRFADVALDALFIAIVAFAISVSMAQLYADKYNYDVDANQELIAHGICNAVSANFNCYCMCVSLSRSAVLDSIGVRTQVYALWSCLLILLVIYFIAPLFSALPNCVLAAIIIIALKGLFMQFKDIPKYWKISGTDLSVWIVTFVAVVIMDVGYGLVIGVLYCLLTVVGRTQKPYPSILGKMPGSTSYKDVAVFQKAEHIPGVVIFRYDNAVYYANKDHFLESMFDMSENNPKSLKVAMTKCLKKRENGMKKGQMTEDQAADTWPMPQPNIHHVIIDCSVISYTDAMGVIALRQAYIEYKDIGVQVTYAAMNDGMREMLESGGFFEKAKQSAIYPSVHDAVYDSLQEYPELQKTLCYNIVDAPYLDPVDSTSPDSDLRKRAMSVSKFRASSKSSRTPSNAEKGGAEEYEDIKTQRSASQTGYYNPALVVDDVMDIDNLDKELHVYEETSRGHTEPAPLPQVYEEQSHSNNDEYRTQF